MTEEKLTPNEWENLYRLLADARRRRVLKYLYFSGTPMSIDDLSRRIHRRERPSEWPDNRSDLDRVLTSLRHVHLPKLERAGLIEWDREESVVRLGARTEELPLFSPLRGVLIGASRDRAKRPVADGSADSMRSETD